MPAPAIPARSDAAGVLWMLLSCAILSSVAALGRHAALEGVPLFQIVLARVLFAALAMTPMLARRGREMLRTRQRGLYVWRIGVGTAAMTTYFGALTLAPVGEVTAIGFLLPLFATMGAALFLGEAVGWRRWGAIAVGFVGALVILRPGFAETSPGLLLAVSAALGMAAATLLIKRLSAADDPDKIVLITTLGQIALLAIPGLLVWQPLTGALWATLAAMGFLGMLGQITLARAFRAADASVVMGADFSRLPFAVLFGWIAFGEVIDLATWAGAGLIFAAAFYTARRERRLARDRPTPQHLP